MASSIYIPTNSAGGFRFFHTFFSIYCLWTFFFFFLTLHNCISFAKYQNESATGIHVFPILNPDVCLCMFQGKHIPRGPLEVESCFPWLCICSFNSVSQEDSVNFSQKRIWKILEGKQRECFPDKVPCLGRGHVHPPRVHVFQVMVGEKADCPLAAPVSLLLCPRKLLPKWWPKEAGNDIKEG